MQAEGAISPPSSCQNRDAARRRAALAAEHSHLRVEDVDSQPPRSGQRAEFGFVGAIRIGVQTMEVPTAEVNRGPERQTLEYGRAVV